MTEPSSLWHDAIHSLKQGIAIIAPDGTLQHVNHSWAAQAANYGLSPIWDRPGVNVLQLFNDNPHSNTPFKQHLLDHFDHILEGAYPYYEIDFYMDFAVGRRWFHTEVIPFTKQGSTIIKGITVTFLDITKSKESENQLKDAVSQLSILQGYLPICAVCKKIKDDDDKWNPVEIYLKRHTCVEFTHDICPTCIRLLYPKYSSILDHPHPSE